MPQNAQWITVRIAEARKKDDSVTNAVADRMEKLLGGELSEQSLSTTKLSNITKLLLDDMIPVSSATETKE